MAPKATTKQSTLVTDLANPNVTPWFRSPDFTHSLDILKRAVSTDVLRHVITTVLYEQGKEGNDYLVATDTHRMTVIKMDKAVSLAPRIPYGEPGYGEDQHTERVLLDATTLQPVEDQEPMYPAWRRIIPDGSTRSVTLPHHALVECLKYLKPMAKDCANRIRLYFTVDAAKQEATCKITCTHADGKAKMEYTISRIPVRDYSVIDGFAFAMNYAYLEDAITFKGKYRPYAVTLEFTENTRPFIVRLSGDDHMFTIIMPMSMEDDGRF